MFDQNEGSFSRESYNNSKLSKICWTRTFQSSLWDDAWMIHKEVFGESKHVQESGRKSFPLLLVAYSQSEEPVAFKMGYEVKPYRFYSWLGGVLQAHRHSGVATDLMRLQHDVLKKLGYREVETKTKNKWKEMLILNLKSGFDIVGCYTDHVGDPKIILRKDI